MINKIKQIINETEKEKDDILSSCISEKSKKRKLNKIKTDAYLLIKNILEHEETKTNNNVISLDPFAGNGITINIKRVTKDNKIIIDGNTASALGALYGGLQFAAWYPITPASSLSESVNEYIAKIRTDPETGIATCAVVQAEDELAAVGMAVGAGWAGLRSMTATSGPGLCLMAEFIGLAYFAEIPLVIWDVQRVGPSTGLPTHTSQGDLAFSYFISHGDKDIILLLPANINECFEFGWKALDIAEQLQTPVIVLSDLELGMNLWMSDEFSYPDKELKRGKILWEEELEKIVTGNKEKWGRYKDLDRDGIPYRTVPGNLHPQSAYFTRGTGHDPFAHYSEDAKEWEDNLLRLKRKVKKAKDLLPPPIEEIKKSSNDGIISYGSSHFPVIEAVDGMNLQVKRFDYLRLRGIPFNESVSEFLNNHNRVFIVENNRDGQMAQILSVEFPEYAYKFLVLLLFLCLVHKKNLPNLLLNFLAARRVNSTCCF